MNTFNDIATKLAALAPGKPGAPVGWCPPEKQFILASLVMAYQPKLTLEIGVFGGSSFIPMALAHKAINHGQIIGVDAWDTATAVAAQTEEESRKWWSDLDIIKVYRGFMDYLQKLDLVDVSVIHRTPSDSLFEPQGTPYGILHVDGGHSDQAFRDVARFSPHVELGGFCVLDDLNWVGGGVQRAEQRLLTTGFRKLYPLGTGAVYQKKL